MTLRGIITGIAVLFSASIFVSSSWSQSQPNRMGLSLPDDYLDYTHEIKKSVEKLKSEPERSAIGHILADLD